jgi:hypothetical protein
MTQYRKTNKQKSLGRIHTYGNIKNSFVNNKTTFRRIIYNASEDREYPRQNHLSTEEIPIRITA